MMRPVHDSANNSTEKSVRVDRRNSFYDYLLLLDRVWFAELGRVASVQNERHDPRPLPVSDLLIPSAGIFRLRCGMRNSSVKIQVRGHPV